LWNQRLLISQIPFEFNPIFVLDQPLAEIDFDLHPLHSATPEAPLNSAST
jgi:hypothetical protein